MTVQAIFGLDVIAPMYFGHESVDLVVVGPHEGFNAGTFFYTFSGTLGAAYTAIYRGVGVPHQTIILAH